MAKKNKRSSIYLDSKTAQLLKEESEKIGATQVAYIRSLLAQKNELEQKINEVLQLQEQYKIKMSEQQNTGSPDNEKIDDMFVLLKVLFETHNRQNFQCAVSMYEKQIHKIFKK